MWPLPSGSSVFRTCRRFCIFSICGGLIALFGSTNLRRRTWYRNHEAQNSMKPLQRAKSSSGFTVASGGSRTVLVNDFVPL